MRSDAVSQGALAGSTVGASGLDVRVVDKGCLKKPWYFFVRNAIRGRSWPRRTVPCKDFAVVVLGCESVRGKRLAVSWCGLFMGAGFTIDLNGFKFASFCGPNL